MRNLKKILALVLALVMSLSLMAVASADDELNMGDVSDIYAESVDVLTSLKVFQGNKGEFLPKDNITRAEVAAIIYRIATADTADTQKSIYADYNKFSDVASDAWYAGYVNYCANAEYIKGKGFDTNGKAIFKPQDNVTGYEALAMILRAIGYDKNNEFTGSNWQIQTAATAKNRGITNKIAEGTLGGPATREVVAEILCQTILVPVADYSLAFGYRTTDANGNPNETLAKKNFDLEKISGVVVANEYANLETQTTLGANQTKLVTSVGDYTLNVASTLDDIGESRYVYVIPQTGSTRYDLCCSKVYEAAGMNNTYEVTEKVDISTDAKFNTVTSMTKDAATEQYINFGPSTNWKSDWRIHYVVALNVESQNVAAMTDGTSDNAVNRAIATACGKFNLPTYAYANATSKDADGCPLTVSTSDGTYSFTYTGSTLKYITYTKTFAIKDDISPKHQGNIEQIFNIADRTSLKYDPATGVVSSMDGFLVGEVYVGTTSLDDVSDKMSYAQFQTTYINADDEDPINGNEYGNWLKVIDNDNDNVADYVLKVIYTWAQVSNVDSNGVVTLNTKDQSITDSDSVNNLTTQTVVCADELATGNVVYYAVIDNKAQTYVPEMITTKFEKVDRNAKTATAVSNDTVYNEGGVHNHTGNPNLEATVANLSGTYTYDVYLTRGSHLGVFTHNPTSNWTLLTNGWYDRLRGGVEYAALAYIDGKQVDTDVTRGGSLFIGPNGVQNNDWNAMKALGNITNNSKDVDYNPNGSLSVQGALNYRVDTDPNHRKALADDEVRTAMVYLSADGTVLPVDRVYNNKTVNMIALDEIPNTNAPFYGTAYQTSIAANTAYDMPVASTATAANQGVITSGVNTGKVELRALSNTVYYYVYRTNTWNSNDTRNYVVDMYTGYAAAPKVDRSMVEDIYAVGTLTGRNSGLVYGNSNYYTADVVVVELNTTYKQKGEQVFIYDMPYVSDGIGTETIKYINSNGEMKEDQIDLDDSSVRRYLSAYGKIQPGLYYMYPTTRDGIYTIEQMSWAEIAANNYAIGQSNTSVGTGSADHIDLQAWNQAGPVSQASNRYNFSGNTAEGKIYKLSYTSETVANKYGWNFSANLSAYPSNYDLNSYIGEQEINRDFDPSKGIVEHDSVGPRYTDGSTPVHTSTNCGINGATGQNRVVWNHNDMLVHYGSNGTILYAISFANFDANRTAGSADIGRWPVVSGQNFAQDVWQSLLYTTDVTNQALTFYGVGDNDNANKDLDRDLTDITVSNSTAVKAGDVDREIVVTPGTTAISNVHVYSVNGVLNGTPDSYPATKDAWGVWTITLPVVDADTPTTTYLVDVVDANNNNTRYTLTVNDRIEDLDELKSKIGSIAISDWATNETDKTATATASIGNREWNAEDLVAQLYIEGLEDVALELDPTKYGDGKLDPKANLRDGSEVYVLAENEDGVIYNITLTVGTAYTIIALPAGIASITYNGENAVGMALPAGTVLTVTPEAGYAVGGSTAATEITLGADIDGNTSTFGDSKAIGFAAPAADTAVNDLEQIVADKYEGNTQKQQALQTALASRKSALAAAAAKAASSDPTEAAAGAAEIAAIQHEIRVEIADVVTIPENELDEMVGHAKPLYSTGITVKVEPASEDEVATFFVSGTPSVAVSAQLIKDDNTDTLMKAFISWNNSGGANLCQVTTDESGNKTYSCAVTAGTASPTLTRAQAEALVDSVFGNGNIYMPLIDCRGHVELVSGQDADTGVLSYFMTKTAWDALQSNGYVKENVTSLSWASGSKVNIDFSGLEFGA